MAWIAQQMPGVVEEFVKVGVSAEYRCGALVETDEIEDEQRQERGAAQPHGGADAGKIQRAWAGR